MDISEYSLDSFDSGIADISSPSLDYLSSGSTGAEMDAHSQRQNYRRKIEYLSRSYIEMPQTGEVNYISTIVGVSGNPVYKGQGVWVQKADKSTSTAIKVDKDDIRAKRHYLKTLNKDGREIKIWECGLCGKEFRFQYTLVRHIPTHTDVRNYQCDICPKAFRQLSTLAQHKATHWNMRPFSCNFCKKSFNRISTLISHKKIHYDEKKHVCDYCGKGFHQKGNLRNHMYTHTNERPYKCEICGKGFNQKSNLVCHKISTHSRKYNYHCESCDINFGKQNLYNYHLESVHGLTVNIDPPKRNNSSINIWDRNSTLEPQCSIIDEANNIIYSLPVSVENKENNGYHNNMDYIFKGNDKSSETEILATIDQEPTNTMLELFKNNKIPFVFYYGIGEIHPKVCKVELRRKHYVLKNPSKDDISKYLVTNSTSTIKHKFSIVAKIYEKKESYGNIQYLVIPNGIPSPIKHNIKDESEEDKKITLHSENSNDVVILPENNWKSIENENSAIIYTKTQPNIRQIQTKSEQQNTIITKLNIFGQELPALRNIIFNPEIVSVYGACHKDNKVSTNFVHKNDTNNKIEKPGSLQSHNLRYEKIKAKPSVFIKQENISEYQSSDQFRCVSKVIVQNKSLSNSLETIKVKKEYPYEDEIAEQSNEYNDPEATLLSSPDSNKEPLAKFNLDFGGSMDFLDICPFNDSFLDNEAQNILNEAPLSDFLTSP